MQQSAINNTRLLIIEDHNIVALGLKTLLSEHDFLSEIDSVSTAKRAIELTVIHPYDLYIIDVELPDMTGIELIKSLKTLSPDSAFIFHTIHDEFWTLRQMINQSLPQALNSLITIGITLASMVVLSVPLTLVSLAMTRRSSSRPSTR